MVGVTGSFGHAPVQRQYFLGAASTVRGYLPGVAPGPTVALGRIEGGWGLPAIRGIVFGDIGWAGRVDSLDGIGSVGFGISIGQGILRVDMAWGVYGQDGFAVSFTGNGLL